MAWSTFISGFGLVLIVLYLFFGIDDLLWFFIAFITRMLHPEKKQDDVLDFKDLRSTPPKSLAVIVPAWHEANVIGNVIVNTLLTTDYPKSMYHIFVGVYPNDPATLEEVRAVSDRFPNVHPVINCLNGPTTKAQNLNHVIAQIRRFEEEQRLRFAAVTVHDSEDVVHAYELLATNYLIDRHDALQFPVFPILEMPRWKNFFRQLTTATYADEFAENHYLTLVDRRNVGAFVPCAGTGFALSRRLLDSYSWHDILPSESLTEDYLLSLSLYKRGIQLHYVLDKLPRVTRSGKVHNDYITTRALFPNNFKAAVRQKTRWTYGITMQSIGLREVFTKEHIPLTGRYTFYKDAKGKLVNLIPVFGYLASIYCLLSIFMHLDPLYTRESAVYGMAVAVFVIMILRQIIRGYALAKVYGFRSMFFGCLVPPLFPIRLIYGNIINFVAAVNAFRMQLRSKRAAHKEAAPDKPGDAERGRPGGQSRPPEAAPGSEKPAVRWAKTDHEFLSANQLRPYRRMLGDTLLVQGTISPAQLNEALNRADAAHGEHVGDYLVRHGFITEDDLMRALSHVEHILYIPDPVAEKLDIVPALEGFERDRLRELHLVPLTVEAEKCVVGLGNRTPPENAAAFQSACALPVETMFLSEAEITACLDRAPGEADRRFLDSLPLYRSGAIPFEQLVLIGIYAELLGQPEDSLRRYMGICADA